MKETKPLLISVNVLVLLKFINHEINFLLDFQWNTRHRYTHKYVSIIKPGMNHAPVANYLQVKH